MSFMDIFKKKPNIPEKGYILDYRNEKPIQSDINKIQPSDDKVKQPEVPKKVAEGKTVKPEDKPLGKFCFDSPLFSSSDKDANDSWFFPRKYPVYSRTVLEKKTIIAIAVENTVKACQYNNEILKLINKVVEDNKNALFLFIRMEQQNKYFELLEYNDLKAHSLPDCLLSLSSSSTKQIKLSDALTYICDYALLPKSKLNHTLTFKNKKFEVDNFKAIFIGTGAKDSDPSETKLASEFLQLLCESKNVKAIKYFCTKDEDTINAALIGFPVIGHIESNFYA